MTSAATLLQSVMGPMPFVISMCGMTPSMRSRTSFWKPFMTESTMMSAATPSAIRCDGHAGDERKEAVLAASPASCSRVGEADGQFKRNFHGLTR